MNKRIFSIFSLLVLVSLVLAACAPAAPTEAPPAPTEAPAVTAAPAVTEAPTEAPVVTEAPTEAPAMTEAPTEAPVVTEAPTTAPAAGAVPTECQNDPDEAACAVFASGDTVKIGFAGPMTGDYSAFGQDISQGAQVCINQSEGVQGWKVELLVEDTQGSPEGGASVANLYSSNPDVVAIHGHTFSGSTAAAIPIYNESRRPMLSASATRADLTTGDQDVFNRIAFTDDVQGTDAATYIYNVIGARKIALMHDGDAYGQGLATKVGEVFQSLGGEVVATQAITAGETDYSAVLTEIGAQAPDLIYYGGYYAEAAVIANQMATAGLGDAKLFSDDGTFGASFLDLAGSNAEGAYATSAVPPSSPELDAFNQAYKDAYGIPAGQLSTFTWHGCDVANALISAIQQVAVVGDDGNLYVPREALIKAVRNLDYQGITGEIKCDESGECNTAGPTFFQVQNGEWVQAPSQ